MQRLNFVSKTPLKSEWLYILRGSESEQMKLEAHNSSDNKKRQLCSGAVRGDTSVPLKGATCNQTQTGRIDGWDRRPSSSECKLG